MADLAAYRKLPAIALIRDLVRSFWGVEVAFADARGYVLTHAEGVVVPPQNPLCQKALASKEGFRRCNESVRIVAGKLGARADRPVVHECHLGFDIVAAPIRLDGKLAGFLFAGGGISGRMTGARRNAMCDKMRTLTAAPDEVTREDLGRAPKLSPADRERLAEILARGAAEVAAAHRRQPARARQKVAGSYPEIAGISEPMREVFALLDKIAATESTVLIHGESGTGKELIARAIHNHGPRAGRPFVAQNCSAFNDNLLESALFGHVRGAFTGAIKDSPGLFRAADGGTLFLDEIGDMSPALQVKLLRALQEGTVIPVGSTDPVSVNVRVIAASHKDLAALVAAGAFREDLYYRVNVLRVSLPPLRERGGDLEILAHRFAAAHAVDGVVPRLSDGALAAMRRYPWPGNVRELENEIERMVVLAADRAELSRDLLSPRIRDAASSPALSARAALRTRRRGTLRQAVEEVEAKVIAEGLIRTHWNKSQLAKELGISRSSLIQKCRQYGLDTKAAEDSR